MTETEIEIQKEWMIIDFIETPHTEVVSYKGAVFTIIN